MNKRVIDLSDIKENDLEKTSSFVDLMSRSERRKRQLEKEENNIASANNDIEDMVEERKRSTKDLTIELEKIKRKETEEKLKNTQKLELTRQMKFNVKENVKEERKKGYNYITFIGIFILIALAYFIYSLIFTNYLDNEKFLLIDSGIILLMFLLFGITILTTKKNNKFLSVLNLLILIGYIIFNALNILGYLK